MIIGIDLGTTNSLCALWRDGQAELVPNALGETLTPSIVSVDDDGQVLVGRSARERLFTHPDSTVAAFKRLMGSATATRLGRRTFRPEELSSLVLRALKADAEALLGEPVDEAVISVPAYFNDTQRKATRLAGELAGLRVERLVNEPTAAALAYGLHEDADDRRILVFDLGGGTFDVSVLEFFDGVMEVHASAGDNVLGGEDFVDALVRQFAQAHQLDPQGMDRRLVNRLREQAEQAKRQLNTKPEAVLRLAVNDNTLEWTVTQTQYERLIDPILQRIRAPVERALRDCGLQLEEIDDVVLVGGSTRKTVVQRLVARMFGRLPLRRINPDEVVALGAAVQAGLKARDAALKERVLTDVCPYTLGVEVSNRRDALTVDGLFAPVIERNTVIPASRMQTFYPMHDRQSELRLKVYQGESAKVRENILLGELSVPLPPGAVDESAVDVRFTYDVNGLLEVEATVQRSGQTHRLVIQQRETKLSAGDIAARLKKLEALKIHPRDQALNVLLLSRANRLYQEFIGDMRGQVMNAIASFEAALASQEPRRIARESEQFAAFLDALEARLWS